ncbi:MAG: MBL fold metallo-hydrolase [Clostridiales bacterium]|nr:MBL fold metallo-hydrolase [Clostridiales bacterium]
MLKKLAALLLSLVTLMSSSGQASDEDYLYMINVGKGDAIVVHAGGKDYLIDTGKGEVFEKVLAALNRLNVSSLEGVFLTHTDKDHSGGLKKLAKSGIGVVHWYASAYYTDKEDKHPLVKALKKTGAEVTWLKAGDSVDGIFSVLGPLLPNAANEDDNSLVMLLDTGKHTVLLTGDMEKREEKSLLAAGGFPECDVFKVPNHADGDVCVYMDLSSLNAKAALISTDPYDKPGTPDLNLLDALNKAGMQVYGTYDSENGIMVTLSDEIEIIID